MYYSGNINKMLTRVNESNMALYTLPIGDHFIDMNSMIGSHVYIEFSGLINCIYCGRKTKKSFNQGYCFPCVKKLARCDTCIIKPELCHFSSGTCREPSWGKENCLQDHFVYIANTSTIKVGITKFIENRCSSRWIDQGATQAVPVFRVKERLLSGILEKALATYIGDKTNWREMLKGQPSLLNLTNIKDDLLNKVVPVLNQVQDEYGIQSVNQSSVKPIQIHYPVKEYPTKIKSINLDKDLTFKGQILGIKAQYLLLSEDRVINLRKYSGYNLNVQFS